MSAISNVEQVEAVAVELSSLVEGLTISYDSEGLITVDVEDPKVYKEFVEIMASIGIYFEDIIPLEFATAIPAHPTLQ